MNVGILNYGAGNLTSIANAIRWVGHEPRMISSRDELDAVSSLILPGVGAFGYAMKCLDQAKLIDPVRNWANSGKPLLGICLGMQLLANGSEEDGWTEGFGLVDGIVRAIPRTPGIRIPHMGWNEVYRIKSGILWGNAKSLLVYHVHGYSIEFNNPTSEERWLTGVSKHGVQLTSMIEFENIMATQFHPEKSQNDGLNVLTNFFEAALKC